MPQCASQCFKLPEGLRDAKTNVPRRAGAYGAVLKGCSALAALAPTQACLWS